MLLDVELYDAMGGSHLLRVVRRHGLTAFFVVGAGVGACTVGDGVDNDGRDRSVGGSAGSGGVSATGGTTTGGSTASGGSGGGMLGGAAGSGGAAGAGSLCENTCEFSDDDTCDDGGPDADSDICEYGTDCGDCGGRAEGICTDACIFFNDGACDDGGPDSDTAMCALGNDCTDCGVRPPPE